MVLSLSSGVIDIKLEMADAEEVLLPMIGRSGCSGSSLAMTVSGAAEDIKKGSQAVVMAATVGAASVVVESVLLEPQKRILHTSLTDVVVITTCTAAPAAVGTEYRLLGGVKYINYHCRCCRCRRATRYQR